jgi:hypothetical protein
LLRLRVSHEGAERELKWPLAGHKQTVFELEDVSDITAEQKHHRAMWLFDGAPSAP